VSYPAPINEGAEYAYYFSQSGTLWETFGVCAFVRMGETTGQEDSSMRTSILAMIVAFGTTTGLPALAQQSAGPSQQQMQDEADKGVKTRNS